MLTFFTSWWEAEAGVLPRERLRLSLQSWKRLAPDCEVILFSMQEEAAALAKELGVMCVSDVAEGPNGTLLLGDVFERAERHARHDLLCYVNGDIVLLDDFIPAIVRVREWCKRFLVVGECIDFDLARAGTDALAAPGDLRQQVRELGSSRGRKAIDYFVFPRGTFPSLPPFSLGRAVFDNWLLWYARSLDIPVIDASSVVTAIHQHHDYSHVPGGVWGPVYGADANRNLELVGSPSRMYFLWDANYRLTPTAIRPNLESVLRARNHLDDVEGRIRWRLNDLRARRGGRTP